MQKLTCVLLLIAMIIVMPAYSEGTDPKGATPDTVVAAGAPGTMKAQWECVTKEAAFSPRDTAEDAVFLGKMWLSNGYYHGNVLYRDLYNSTDGISWTQVSDATPYDGYAELIVYKDKLWAIKSSVWNSPDGINWTQVATKTPFGTRGYGELVVHDGKMWQIGSAKDVWNTTDGVNWTKVADDLPYGDRYAAAVAVFGGKMWLMGGSLKQPNDPPEKGYEANTTFNDVWCSEDGVTWTRVAEHASWAPRQWFTARAYAGKLWVIGGYDNVNAANLGDVWCTTDGVNWTEATSENSFSGRHEPTCYVYKGSLWLAAGNSWPVLNDVWRLTLPEGAEK